MRFILRTCAFIILMIIGFAILGHFTNPDDDKSSSFTCCSQPPGPRPSSSQKDSSPPQYVPWNAIPPSDTQVPAAIQKDPDLELNECVIPKIQNGHFSAADGGRSILDLQEACSLESAHWIDRCESSGVYTDQDCSGMYSMAIVRLIDRFGSKSNNQPRSQRQDVIQAMAASPDVHEITNPQGLVIITMPYGPCGTMGRIGQEYVLDGDAFGRQIFDDEYTAMIAAVTGCEAKYQEEKSARDQASKLVPPSK